LQPGQSIDVRFRVKIASGLPAGTTLTNTGVVTWNNPPQTASATVSIDVGGVPGAGSLNGTAWLDANFNKIADLDEPRLQGWRVDLYRNGVLVQSVVTDASGVYRFASVPPTSGTTERYELQFTAPGGGPKTAKLGKADSVFTNWLQRITDIAVPSGSNLQNLNLPIGPWRANSLTRVPIAGVTVNMLTPAALCPSNCSNDRQRGQITQAGGCCRFDINFGSACSGGASAAPGNRAGVDLRGWWSKLFALWMAAAFSVPMCWERLTRFSRFIALASELNASLRAARNAESNLNLMDGTAVPGSSQIYNNHSPPPQLAVFSI
jgi:hypothetical protein